MEKNIDSKSYVNADGIMEYNLKSELNFDSKSYVSVEDLMEEDLEDDFILTR